MYSIPYDASDSLSGGFCKGYKGSCLYCDIQIVQPVVIICTARFNTKNSKFYLHIVVSLVQSSQSVGIIPLYSIH